MAFYECTFIARQDLAKSDVEKLTDEVVSILEKREATVHRREYWGIRPLAYEINKNRKGHYTMLVVEGNELALEAYRTYQRLSEETLRNLEIRVDELNTNPSIMMRDHSEAA